MAVLQAISNDFPILTPDEQINPLTTVNVTKYMACSRIAYFSHVSKIAFKELARADALFHFRS
ncbi:hypothetical protein [Fulvivirga kasyanovii]|uniref:hypothetical protein n=1 Tax=Fulvivirga kasyanovii TaxID=396812 RepID=UPI0031DE7944